MAHGSIIGEVKIGATNHRIASTVYGECSTAAATAAKTVTLADSESFTLLENVTIRVKFTNTNTVANPTLNVNSTGAKAIVRYGTTAAGTSQATSWKAGEIVALTYVIVSSTGYWMMNKPVLSTASITGTNGTESITPYTFADVGASKVTLGTAKSIPNVTGNTSVTAAGAPTNGTAVTFVPVTAVSPTLASRLQDTATGNDITSFNAVGSHTSVSTTTYTVKNVSATSITSPGTASMYSITSVGSMTTAAVASGVLTITNGSAPTRGNATTVITGTAASGVTAHALYNGSTIIANDGTFKGVNTVTAGSSLGITVGSVNGAEITTGSEVTITPHTHAANVTATNTTLGTAISVPNVTEVTNVTASKATAGTAVTVAKAASSATTVLVNG